MSATRTRWAAVGAAVAVTLGGGGVAMVSATSPAEAVTFVPITPCRVVDTRPGLDNVGPRATPLAANETYTIDAVADTDNAGDCSGVIPTSATAISMNVTTLDATALTFLTIWDGSLPRPAASSLNPAPGQPPTPNAVTTSLDAGGQFSIYNLTGSVHVLADVNGYYTDHHHDDRYYTKQQSDDRFTTPGENDARYYTKQQSDARYQSTSSGAEAAWTFVDDDNGSGVVAEVTVDVEEVGYVIVNTTAQAQILDGPLPLEGRIQCSITTGTTIDQDHLMITPVLTNGEGTVVAGSRAFTISGVPRSGERTYRLVCNDDPAATAAELISIHLNAVFVPDSDAQGAPIGGG